MNNLTRSILSIVGIGSAISLGVTSILCFFCFFGIIGIWVWPYTLNTWLLFLGKAAKVVWWQGFLLGVFPPLGILGIVSAIVTWIAMLFLV